MIEATIAPDRVAPAPVGVTAFPKRPAPESPRERWSKVNRSFRRPAWDRANPLRTIRITGLIGALMMVSLGGHLAAPVGQVAPTPWLKLLGAYAEPWQRGVAGASLIVGLLLVAVSFLRLARAANDGTLTVRQVAITCALWSLPFLIGPPLMSLDINSYVAHGAMLDRGVDPYRFGPEFIRGAVYQATDPRWRAARAPYGPLALIVSRLAFVSGAHSAVGGVIALRVIAALSILASAFFVVRLAQNRALALALVAASPVTLVTLLSAAHHEALMTALILGALVSQRNRHPFIAVVCAAAAVADKLPGAVALGALGVWHLADSSSLGERARVLLRDGLACTVVWVPLALLVPDPLGWVRALSTPGLGRTGYAPVTLISDVTFIPANITRAGCEALSVLIVARLLMTIRRRPIEATMGWGLLSVALLGPVLYTWYLAPAAAVLATLPGAVPLFWSAACGAQGLLLVVPRFGPWAAQTPA